MNKKRKNTFKSENLFSENGKIFVRIPKSED